MPFAPVLLHTEVGVPAFIAEVRHVHDRGRVIGAQAQDSTGWQGGQPFARLQHRQWAKLPQRVQIFVECHAGAD